MADRVPRHPLESESPFLADGQPGTVQALFEERAARHPDSVALELGEERLTYGALNRRANFLAERLRAKGVGPDVLVAVCLERSIDAIVGLLGILKAGGAYLPLDTVFPLERLRFMIPSAFVVLEALPLSANGKVDRRALPPPDAQARQEKNEGLVAPRSDLESAIARIWSEVLGVDPIGVHENFFELGGHSLLATKAISRLRDSLRLEVSLRTLFQFPTISRFAEAVSGVAILDGERLDERIACATPARTTSSSDLPSRDGIIARSRGSWASS